MSVLTRDNYTCRYCGGRAPEVRLTVDHVIAVALGGSDLPDNLVTACADCNAGKAAVPPNAQTVAEVSEDAIRWARAIEAAADLLEHDYRARVDYREAFVQSWNDPVPPGCKPLPLPHDFAATIELFRTLGVTVTSLRDAIDIAIASPANCDHVFNYMCGVIWKRVREMQEIARRALMEAGS